MNENERFFYDAVGYSYDPVTETPEEGRRARVARALASAEARAEAAGITFDWVEDDVPFECGCDDATCESHDPHTAFGCILRDARGESHGSLWWISFGSGGNPFPRGANSNVPDAIRHAGTRIDPYARIVQAELALEYFAHLDQIAESAGPNPFNLK
jgi:hypothetical protein